MRRKLMKQLRKGNLSPAAKRELMELDESVTADNRRRLGRGALGLGAALAIASKTGALGAGKDALGDFLDNREAKKKTKRGLKDGETLLEGEAEYIKQRAEDMENLSASDPNQKGKVLDEIEIDDTDMEEEPENFQEDRPSFSATDDLLPMLAATKTQSGPQDGPTREDLDSFAGKVDTPVLGTERTLPSSEFVPNRFETDVAIEDLKPYRRKGFIDEAPIDTDYTGGFGSDIDYSDLQGLRDRDLRRRQLASDKRDREAGVASGRRIAFDASFPAGMPLASQDGPRVENASGGNTPFLRKMRDRLRKKYKG